LPDGLAGRLPGRKALRAKNPATAFSSADERT